MRFVNSFIYPFIFISVFWIIWLFEHFSGFDLSGFGVYPRHIEGLKGIIGMPFLHDPNNYGHLMSNSLPFVVLGAGVIYFYPEVAARVWAIIWLMTGSLVWLFARGAQHNEHIGASGIIYGFAAFLFFGGIFRRNLRLMAISLLVSIYYGGIVWGILPMDPKISWEGHLFGALSGILAAYIYKNKGPKRKKHDWENEQDTDDNQAHISHYIEVKPR